MPNILDQAIAAVSQALSREDKLYIAKKTGANTHEDRRGTVGDVVDAVFPNLPEWSPTNNSQGIDLQPTDSANGTVSSPAFRQFTAQADNQSQQHLTLLSPEAAISGTRAVKFTVNNPGDSGAYIILSPATSSASDLLQELGGSPQNFIFCGGGAGGYQLFAVVGGIPIANATGGITSINSDFYVKASGNDNAKIISLYEGSNKLFDSSPIDVSAWGGVKLGIGTVNTSGANTAEMTIDLSANGFSEAADTFDDGGLVIEYPTDKQGKAYKVTEKTASLNIESGDIVIFDAQGDDFIKVSKDKLPQLQASIAAFQSDTEKALSIRPAEYFLSSNGNATGNNVYTSFDDLYAVLPDNPTFDTVVYVDYFYWQPSQITNYDLAAKRIVFKGFPNNAGQLVISGNVIFQSWYFAENIALEFVPSDPNDPNPTAQPATIDLNTMFFSVGDNVTLNFRDRKTAGTINFQGFDSIAVGNNCLITTGAIEQSYALKEMVPGDSFRINAGDNCRIEASMWGRSTTGFVSLNTGDNLLFLKEQVALNSVVPTFLNKNASSSKLRLKKTNHAVIDDIQSSTSIFITSYEEPGTYYIKSSNSVTLTFSGLNQTPNHLRDGTYIYIDELEVFDTAPLNIAAVDGMTIASGPATINTKGAVVMVIVAANKLFIREL